MMRRNSSASPTAAGVVMPALVLVLILLAAGCGANEKPVATAEDPQIDGKAAEVLKGMTAKLSAARQITIRGSQTTDAELLEKLDKLELAQLVISLKRPNRFVAGTTSEDRERRMFYDGQTFSILDVGKNFYSSVPMTGDFDQVVERLDEKFGFSPPVAELLMSDPYEYLVQGVDSVSYVGEETVGDTRCHHLLAVEELLRWDVWITVEGLDLLKLVATATSIADEPKVKIEIAEIDLSPQLDDGMFVFEPPAGAQSIRMVPVEEIYEEEGTTE